LAYQLSRILCDSFIGLVYLFVVEIVGGLMHQALYKQTTFAVKSAGVGVAFNATRRMKGRACHTSHVARSL
jgi:hypothetical protein